MSLLDDERQLLRRLYEDSDGTLRTKARPSDVVKRLAEKRAIVNVLTTTLSPSGLSGGASFWKITDTGRALVEGTFADGNGSSGKSRR